MEPSRPAQHPVSGVPSTRPRRRVSRRRYQLRRAVALTVCIALIGLGVAGVRTVLSGGSSATAIDGSGVPISGVGTTEVVGPSSSSTVDPAASTTVIPDTTVAPEPVGPPSAASPATLLIAGDSDAGAFGPYLQQVVGSTGVVTTTLDYKVSSGLARPDFFDWPTHFTQELAAVQPDIVVVTFGGNDAQGLSRPDGSFIVGQPTGDGDEQWRAEYGARVGAVMDQLSADGRTLIWVGIPNHQSPEVTKRMQVQDEVVRAEAAKRPKVRFVDTWAMFSGKEGGYAEYHVDPRDGQGKDVRADDGFHLNTVGAEILALAIADVVKDDLRERGAAI